MGTAFFMVVSQIRNPVQCIQMRKEGFNNQNALKLAWKTNLK